MKAAHTNAIDLVSRYALPGLAIAFLFILSVVPMNLPHFGPVRPYFMLMAVFFFAVYRPAQMPPSLAFILGILIDLVSGLPLGMTAMALVATQWVAREQRKFILSQSFSLIWLGFFILVASVCVLQWGVVSLIHLRFLPFAPVVISAVLSVFIFPAVALLLFFVHRVASATEHHVSNRPKIDIR